MSTSEPPRGDDTPASVPGTGQGTPAQEPGGKTTAPEAAKPAAAQPAGAQPARPAVASARAPSAPAEQSSTWQPGLYVRLALLLLAAAYAIAFVVQNTQDIRVDFVFGTARVALIWEILLLLAVGIVGGVLLSQLHRHRRRVRLSKQGAKGRDAGRDRVRRDEAVGKPR